MRRLVCLLLSMLMLCTAALADGFDQTRLEQTKDYTTYMDIHQVNTIVAPPGQPWMGETELEDSEVAVYLDFIQMPDEDMTFLRLTLSLTSYEFVAAGELTITVGGKDYVFDVFPEVWEYDLTYFEDYIICMTDASLPMIKAMARSKTDTFSIKLAGDMTVQGSITLDLDQVAQIYDTYIDCGGERQNLGLCRELWPVMIMKDE